MVRSLIFLIQAVNSPFLPNVWGLRHHFDCSLTIVNPNFWWKSIIFPGILDDFPAPGWLPGTRSSSQPLARWPCRIAGASIWAVPRVAICRRAPQGRSTANTFGERLGRDGRVKARDPKCFLGNHPQMAEPFRLVKYFDLPRFLEVLGSLFLGVFGSFSVTGTGEMEDVASLATINWWVAPIWDFLGMGGCSYHFFQNYILVWKSGMTKTHSDTCLVFSSGWGNPRMKHMGGQMGLNVFVYIYIHILTYEICFGSWYDYVEWQNRVI